MVSGIKAKFAKRVKTKTDAEKLPPKIPAKNSSTQPKGILIILNIVCIYAPSIRAALAATVIFKLILLMPHSFFGNGVIAALAERIAP